ncbi:hypothetical protein UlMin_025022 [Ulmus minor]
MAFDPITDYSQTQRIVLLIDLNPLLHLQNSTPFLTSLLSSVKILLSFPALSSSLFAYKFLFSSLSPLLSSSKVHKFVSKSSNSLYFDQPITTFDALSKTLNSLPSLWEDPSLDLVPRASNLAASMRQLLHDYGWDPIIQDPGTLLNCDSDLVRSNLIVLFSPFSGCSKFLSGFLNVGIDDECLKNVSLFCERFCGLFANVNEAFASRDIQFSWVDVRFELECYDKVGIEELEPRLGFFESGIRSMGWGFCSTDSIVLGSALVPFGLIYPKIGIAPNTFCCNELIKKLNVHLSLEILDISGKPLECKCCDLELVDLKVLPKSRSNNDVLCIPEMVDSQKGVSGLKKAVWESFGDGVHKLQVKALQTCNEFKKFKGHLSDPILVSQHRRKPRENQKESSDEIFADKVLEMLAKELDESQPKSSAPIWQIFSSFLYRQGYWALVSLLDHSGNSYMGILMPFTFSSALLFFISDSFYLHKRVNELYGSEVAQFRCGSLPDPDTSANHSPSTNCSDRDKKNKRSKRNLELLQDHTWSSFCAAAFQHSELQLEEVYFARGCNYSKKLKFLKCWMKQIKNSSSCVLVLEEKSKPQEEIKKEIDDRLTELQEPEQPISLSDPVGKTSLTGASRVQDETATDSQADTPETFFSSLSIKIQQGLESEGLDLGALARRLVDSSIYWLNKRCSAGVGMTSDSQIPVTGSQDPGDFRTAELLKRLLRDPKELIAKCRSNEPSIQASEGSASEKIVKEYELQILFRMEILQSEIGESIGESTRQKFLKQICLLLETIQCHLEGGFFGDWSLDSYVGKIIKARYSNSLGDVVHKIYTKMDLLLFAEEDDLPNHLLNSEESNQSWREKLAKDERGENVRMVESTSAENESLQPQENDNGRLQQGGITQDEHARKLMEAHKRRERARRFSSFTSWVPDLQRVWAPKQSKAMKPKSDRRQKPSKRKNRGVEIVCDSVCETPMTERKRSFSQCGSSDEEVYSYQSCSPVSKALFKDDP